MSDQMDPAEAAAHEALRLAAVRGCGLSPGSANEAFDGIVELAATTLRAPIALVSIVDDAQQWFAARVGLAAPSTGRDVSFCSFAIETLDELFVVPDAREDERFRDNALVTGEPHIRFYAGAPLRTADGFGLGSLCVIDTVPRPGLTGEEERVLQLLARQVEKQIELVRYTDELDRTTAELARGTSELEAERGFFSAALSNLAEGIVACDAEGRLTFLNAVAEQLHGRTADPTLDPDAWTEAYDIYEADGSTRLHHDRLPLLRALAGEQVRDEEVVVAPHDRPATLISCNGQAFHGKDGALLGAVVTMRDVTERRRHEAALRHSAEHDLLTGLPNRSLFSTRLEAALAGEGWRRTAVCFLDLNGFKQVNDDLGHTVGDQVLAAAAGRLAQAVKGTDTVARYGGDEFVVLLTDVEEADLPPIVDRLRNALTSPLRIGAQRILATAAVGAVHAGAEDLRDERTLLRRADQRMYTDKPQ
jgi:diguanylate cyclase (GGDEF)-like protein